MNNSKLIEELKDIRKYINGDCFGTSDLIYEMSLINEIDKRGLE